MNDDASPPLLSADQILRSLDGTELLRGVSLAIHAGDRVAIVGPSGSGKTLLLRALAMLDPIDQGEIRWLGKSVVGNDVPLFRSRVIYLHQRASMIDGTVEDNLRYPFSLKVHQHRHFTPEVILGWLEGLDRHRSFLAKPAGELSGGEAQITALLRAIQLEPDVLLLDEPSAALDQSATQAVESLVSRWLEDRPETRATVWVSHDQSQAMRLADRVLKMQHGQLSEAT